MKKYVLFAMAILLTFSGCKTGITVRGSVGGNSSTIAFAETSSEDTASREATASEVVSSQTTSKVESVSSKLSSKPAIQTSSKASTTSSKTSTTTNTSPTLSGKKGWFDISGLTGTQADVGKVVGYSTLLGEDITVVSVVDKIGNDGLRIISTTYSNSTGTQIKECQYCHGFPCPNGGGRGLHRVRSVKRFYCHLSTHWKTERQWLLRHL